jgi:hypothetical protein
MSPSVMMYVCGDLPFSDEFPDHTDSDTAPEHLVECCVAGRDDFAAVAHDISQKTRRACQSTSDGINDRLHGLRRQSTSLGKIRERKEEEIRDRDESACGKNTAKIDADERTVKGKDAPFFRAD